MRLIGKLRQPQGWEWNEESRITRSPQWAFKLVGQSAFESIAVVVWR
jgi:hypothetical protein